MIAARLKGLFTPSSEQRVAYALYAQAVHQARKPFFYTECGLPDTLDGRFQAIVLHLFLLLHRLSGKEDTFCRYLTEAFFEDMDRSLREIGVTDTGVGKRVRKMARAFYGVMQAYGDSLGDTQAFDAALKRNAYGTVTPTPEQVARLRGYVDVATQHLQALPIEVICSGEEGFSLVP